MRQVRIGYDFMRLGYSIYIIDETGDTTKRRVAQILPNGGLSFIEYESGEMIEPTLILDDKLLHQLVSAIQNDTTIKPESTAKIEGILEAQKEHLNDLRKVLNCFLDKSSL
jgi:hypothetical protein